MEVPQPLRRFVPQFDTLFVSLAGLGPDQLQGSALGAVLRTLQVAKAPPEELREALVAAMRELGKLPAEQRAEWRRAAHYLLLLVRHLRKSDERPDLYSALTEAAESDQREEFDEMAMTDAQVLVAQGRKLGRLEGREEGREEGRAEAFKDLLLLQLERRFGVLTQDQLAKLDALGSDEAATMGVELLDARSLADLGL
jgi:flagellar biosynthesis/type III secretory pathway protein FliH